MSTQPIPEIVPTVFPEVVPRLLTPRLLLRPFHASDASRVQLLAGNREIAETTMTIPHPYPDGAAEKWIARHVDEFLQQKSISFAVTRREDEATIIGSVALMVESGSARGELGYWIGRDYWGQGLATEAASAVMEYSFERLGLHRLWALHFHTNPASGVVMRKLGMKPEGILRQHALKWGQYVDYHCYGILRGDYFEHKKNETA